jgi:signal transduction histidine kinase
MLVTALRKRLRRHLGARLRSALAAAGVVAVATMLAGGLLLITARGVLLRTVDTETSDRAAQASAILDSTDGSGLAAIVKPTTRDRSLVQVLDARGRVVASSEALTGLAPMSPLRPKAGQREQEERHYGPAGSEPLRIVASGVSVSSGTWIVLVGESTEIVDDGTEAMVVALVLGMPLIAIVVGFATFLFVGRSLRPVEAMRRQAARISAKNLHTRLPVPPNDDEIGALASTMNTMLDRIEAASTAQRRFVADASHELRSPLATIHANVDLLLGENDLPEHAATSVTRIQRESIRMARLVDDLLLLARLDDNGLRVRSEDVDLDDLVYAERDRITVEHPRLHLRGAVEPVRVTGDPQHLQRVLRNLVDNATRHAHTSVTVSLTTRGRSAQLVVGNDGPPIPEEDRERIFHRFVRLDDSRTRLGGAGAGLGLAIARDIVTAHHGTLTAHNPDGGGAAMRIRLPLPG